MLSFCEYISLYFSAITVYICPFFSPFISQTFLRIKHGSCKQIAHLSRDKVVNMIIYPIDNQKNYTRCIFVETLASMSAVLALSNVVISCCQSPDDYSSSATTILFHFSMDLQPTTQEVQFGTFSWVQFTREVLKIPNCTTSDRSLETRFKTRKSTKTR